VDSLSSRFASFMAFGDTAAEDTIGVVPEAPATDGAFPRLSQTSGSLQTLARSGGAPSAPAGPGGSDGSGDAAAGASGAGILPETSTEALAHRPGAGYPILAFLVSLLASWLLARRRSVRSAS
jgi:hypothetical protein